MYFAQQPKHKKILGIPTSDVEIKDLLKGWIVISIAFTILLNGLAFGVETLLVFFLSAVTVGTGFLLHELAHKLVAHKYHCWAEFRADNTMLLFSVITAFLGIIFAAPGAVMIYGPHINERQNGIISAAGPLTNFVFALVFLALLLLVQTPFVTAIAWYGFRINSWLGLFNMIPFMNFDGAKIFRWNYFVWGAMVCAGIALLVLNMIIFK